MFDLERFRELAQKILEEKNPVRLRKIVAEMEAMLRGEQSDLKEVLAERRLHYPGPPIEPGLQ